jgi:hypothetical protein
VNYSFLKKMIMMLLKGIHIIFVLLVLNYCFLPVYAVKACKTEACCCCCNHTTTAPSNCDCAVGQSNEKKQPVNTSETSTHSFQTRLLCSPEKLHFPLGLNNVCVQSNQSQFPGQNNFNISRTITRLTIPLRI